MSSSKKKISIIGAGVSGICCALILKKMGFDVIVYSKDDPLSLSGSPSRVSLYPAASVIPHSVSHANLTSIFGNSLSFFDVLFSDDFTGLTVHKHFELFSEKMDIPEYKNQVKDFNLLSKEQLQTTLNHPKITLSTGWEFDCYFADWVLYFPTLIQKYRALGGSIIQKKITPENLNELDSDIIINCAEIGGPLIAGEDFKPVLYRGHIVHVKDAPLLTHQNGKTISYNYTPPVNFYHSEKGNAQDLYCYPRKDGWILGGSRQTGTLSSSGEWIGEDVIEPSIDLDGKIIPEQILSLHQPIIKDAFGFDLTSYPNKTAKIGYRFMGNKTVGLRLDSEEKSDRLIIHNYGHGGAGVTLSWGCAFEVAALLTKQLKGRPLELAEILSVFKF